MARNNNEKVIPSSDSILDQMKLEIANELGIPNYNNIDKGALPARVNGYIGGNMTKRLVALGQAALMQNPQQTIAETTQVPLETPQQ